MQHSLSQQLHQQQILAPQMRQGLEMLASPALELSAQIQQVLESNPTLEYQEEHESLEDAHQQEEELMDDDYLRDEAILFHRGIDAQHEEKNDFLYRNLVAPESLQEYLNKQLALSFVSQALKEATFYLIGSLNAKGFLSKPLQELAVESGLPFHRLKEAQALLESFEPEGVGAEDLRGALLAQLRLQGQESSLAYRLVADHLQALAKNDDEGLARLLKVSPLSIRDARKRIEQLNGRLAIAFEPSYNPSIVPEVVFFYGEKGEWEVHLVDKLIPQLGISQSYKALFMQSRDEATRRYLREALAQSKDVIEALAFRKVTLLRVCQAIGIAQKSFFFKGKKALKVLQIQDIAQTLSLHPTTVSRAVRGKYAQTPWGVIALRAFFSRGGVEGEGKAFSQEAVFHHIAQCIEEEDPRKPLSDKQLVEALKAQGIVLARRTVAKYRDHLGILPVSLRRRR